MGTVVTLAHSIKRFRYILQSSVAISVANASKNAVAIGNAGQSINRLFLP